jgi:hypothetical protein
MCPLSDREKSRLLASKDTVDRLRIAIGSLTTAARRSNRDEVTAVEESGGSSEADGSVTPVPQLGRRPSR